MADSPIENIRHSFAHVLAAAVKKLYPKVELGIGPVIENGFYYDFGKLKITEADLPKIEEEMRNIVKQNLAFKKELWPAPKASLHYKKLKQPYKLDLIQELARPTRLDSARQARTALRRPPASRILTKVGMVHMGDVFLDLCRGGHVKNTSELPLDAFKLTSVAGAYWRGDEKNPMLTRVYGAAFGTKKELDDYLWRQEEAEKRDHRKLGRDLGLFVFSELIGPGLPVYTPKGTAVLQKIKDYSRELRKEIGYQEVYTPQINKAELFKISGHYDMYKESMFHVRSNYTEEEYFLKPMNCPQHTQLYASELRSYKDLPLRFADFANLYRDEKPGELNGLSRLRAFSQDDGHSFCTEDQIEDEFNRVLGAVEKAMKTYAMKYWIRLSLRDEKNKKKYLGDDVTWGKSQTTLRNLLKKKGVEYKEAQGEAAFYGPKMDLMAKDSLGREWQLSTIQLDLNMPGRFGLEYVDEQGKKKTPVMIHAAIVGSPERFLGVLIEHYAGAFPFWLAPEQIWILPVSDKFAGYAQEVQQKLLAANKDFRVRVNVENETLGKRIREGETMKIPYLLVVGEKEMSNNEISVRERGKGNLGVMKLEAFVQKTHIRV
ncbi:MAG: Threonine-tRNA ligase [Candidatus Nomurabacteria bacterium GW2011_GWA1_46_11]|uniref:Threonine--tRNA ligase n=1 Tax=Candidatus Nomurabacteria bacterium GW2011_GWA1_46_11 TaxID=1618732 RepID=A0A0G1RHZ0_9BACT|nr:MAG: Threonine-tRNA ligase [Candidatus Nomurabacteria bacterium GW2011_GWA1_46_11]